MSSLAQKNTVEEYNKKPLLVSGLVVLALASAYFFVPAFRDFCNEAFQVLLSDDKERIHQWVSRFGLAGPLVIILAMIAQLFLIVVPSVLLILIAILSYGPWWGSLISIIAVFASSSVAYVIGAYLGPVTVNRLLGEKAEKGITSFVKRYGIWAISITRLSPLLSSDAISIAAGVLRMQFWRFMLATFAGTLLIIVLISLPGKIEGLKDKMIWISAVGLVIFVGYVWLDRRRRDN